MTQDNLKALAENPKAFLNRSKWNEQNIRLKQEQIQRYKDMAYSITAAIKDVPSFGMGTPSSKIENCVINIDGLERDIQKEISKLREELNNTKEAISLINDKDLQRLLEMRYISQLTWEEISVLMHYSYRWTLRLHGKALRILSKEATKVYTQLAV